MLRSLKFITLFISLIWALCSCQSPASSPSGEAGDTLIQYADLLALESLDNDLYLCNIRDPWNTEHIVIQYLLVPKTGLWSEQEEQKYKERYANAIILRTPLEHMALTSACHAYLLSQWNALNKVAVLCDTAYVKALKVQQWMRSVGPDSTSVVLDGGSSVAPNKEVLLSAQCDALWVSPFENAGLGAMSQLPIPIIYCADYMETSPLGRAEWMKFYGRLVGKPAMADSLFQQVEQRYNLQVSSAQEGESLLAELPYGSTWYVPGGCSTSAHLYEDAGYQYLWSDDPHSGSLSLSKEAVLAKALDCDCWLIKYNAPEGDWTLDNLRQQDPLYSHIKALNLGNVWGCNTAYSDFFDITPFRPDTLLESLHAKDGTFFRHLN